MEKNYKLLIFFIVAGILLAVIGSTFAYWRWSTNSAQNTAVTFTVSSDFSCSADGGGNITSSDKILAPATCTDTTYAIRRTVVVDVTKNGGQDVYLDLKLKVNSIAAELSASENFKYALTTSSSSCTSNVIATGTFNGTTANSEKSLLNNKQYAATNHADTYYLWIWLDTTESNNNTQNKAFNLSLTGTCSNNRPRITSTVYSVSTHDFVTGQTIPRGTTTYNNYQDAINAFGYNVFLKHTVEEDESIETNWCWSLNEDGLPDGNCYGSTYETENECIADLEDNGYYDEGPSNSPYLCAKSSNKVVVSSEIGFVKDGNVYYLHDWDDEESHDENETTLASVFGSNNCNYVSSSHDCQAGAWSTSLGDFYNHHIGVAYSLSGNSGGCTLESYNGVQNSDCTSGPICTDCT